MILGALPSPAQDSSGYTMRSFDQHALDRYRSQEVFRYETDTPPDQMGIWDWIKYKIGEMLSGFFSTKGGSTILKVILYGSMIFAVVAIVFNLAGINALRFLRGNARTVPIAHISEENIQDLNIDDLIAEAVSDSHWRLAVRYQYLKALRMMADRGLIHWRPGKTNMDYYTELQGAELRSAYLTATDDFENVWYGNSDVTQQHYEASKAALAEFYTLIQLHSSV